MIREARAKFKKLGMLWSIGKDSTVLLWLVRKAFFGHVPFPLVHVDTTKKIPEMIAYRDRYAREWGLELIVQTNHEALAGGMSALWDDSGHRSDEGEAALARARERFSEQRYVDDLLAVYERAGGA